MRKLCCILVALALVLLTAGSAAAAQFSDVKSTDYFARPVDWAVTNGVTAGTSATTFSPDATCTRAQVMMFLWRSNSSPEPAFRNNPFRDVTESDYFYKAVMWALNAGITTGTSTTTFEPNAACTRGQVMTFLWRNAGSTEVTVEVPFDDVKKTDYFYKPVQWAVRNRITAGTGARTFSPGAACTRGQVMTFLYQYMGGSEIPQPAPAADHSAYDPVIANTIRYIRGENYDSDYVTETVHLQQVRESNTDASKVGYCLKDLDGDGTEELLLGDLGFMDQSDPENERYYRYFWLLYTIEDGKAKLVTESWERNRHYLGTDGYVYYQGSGGAAYTICGKMQFKDHDLYMLQTAFTDLDEDMKVRYCYKDFSAGVREEDSEASYKTADRNDMTNEQWLAILRNWEAMYAAIPYRPITEY